MNNYDVWKQRGWDDFSIPTLCKQCEKTEQDLDHAREYLEQVIHEIYSTGSLDKRKLEHALDELCWVLNVKTNDGEIQVDRKGAKNVFFLDLMKLNNDLLKQIAQ